MTSLRLSLWGRTRRANAFAYLQSCTPKPRCCIKIYAKSYFSSEIKSSHSLPLSLSLCGKLGNQNGITAGRLHILLLVFKRSGGPNGPSTRQHTRCVHVSVSVPVSVSVSVQLCICSRLVYLPLRQHGQQHEQGKWENGKGAGNGNRNKQGNGNGNRKCDRKDNACTAWKMFVVNIFSLHR